MSAGCVLGECWKCAGCVLDVCWVCAGCVLGVCWMCASTQPTARAIKMVLVSHQKYTS